MSRAESGTGRPFGGQTLNDQVPLVSTTGTIEVQPGKRPVVMDIEEDDSRTPAEPVPRREDPIGQEDAKLRALQSARPPVRWRGPHNRAADPPQNLPLNSGRKMPAKLSCARNWRGANARLLKPQPNKSAKRSNLTQRLLN